MNPITLNSGEQLDPQAVKLMQAIRQKESGGNYGAVGDAGTSKGAFQFQDRTWHGDDKNKGWAEEILGDRNAAQTKENQNKVAYTKIKQWKDQGFTPEQVAAAWNAGEARAKDGSWANNKGTTTINGKKIAYDTPTYVQDVLAIATGKKPGLNQVQTQQKNNVATSANVAQADAGTPTAQPEKKEGLLKRIARGILSPVATTVARPLEALAVGGAKVFGGEGAADRTADALDKFSQDKLGGYVAPIPREASDVTKDVGRAAETVALGLPVNSIKAAATAGAVSGLGSGLEQGKDLEGVVKEGALGGGLGVAGGALGKLAEFLPKRLTETAFKNISSEGAERALATKSVGTTNSLFRQSQKEIDSLGKQVQEFLKNPQKLELVPEEGLVRSEAMQRTLANFPEYAGKKGVDAFKKKIGSLIPATSPLLHALGVSRKGALDALERIANGEASLVDRNMVRSILDNVASGGYSKLAKAISPNAGHDLAITFAHNLRDEVQTLAPDTVPLFKQMAKEMEFSKILKDIAKKKSGLLKFNDLIPFVTGQALGGPLGGLGVVATTRALENPAVQFGIAKAGNKASKALVPSIKRSGLIPQLTANRESK